MDPSVSEKIDAVDATKTEPDPPAMTPEQIAAT